MINVFTHQIYDCLRLVGFRDRLRCPSCKSIGTWKPHGGWLDREDERKVRRWMCKWCGIYNGPEGWQRVTVGSTCWVLDNPRGSTPKNVIENCFGPTNPWVG